MGTVSLEGLAFYAYHGHYEEEKKLGSKFIVDIHLELDFEKACSSDQLQDTIDYEKVYRLIQEEMKQPVHLIEKLGNMIIEKMMSFDHRIEKAEIIISKINPPIGGTCDRAKITMKKTRL